MKQICTITQKYKLWDNCFYLCVYLPDRDAAAAAAASAGVVPVSPEKMRQF